MSTKNCLCIKLGFFFFFSLSQAPDEEFEEHLRHLIGDQCTGDRNEVTKLLRSYACLLLFFYLLCFLLNLCISVTLSSTYARPFQTPSTSIFLFRYKCHKSDTSELFLMFAYIDLCASRKHCDWN